MFLLHNDFDSPTWLFLSISS